MESMEARIKDPTPKPVKCIHCEYKGFATLVFKMITGVPIYSHAYCMNCKENWE